MVHCSRFCNGQSTQEPHGSTGLAEETVSYSIDTTYFHLISTDFHKQPDLFWEQGVLSSSLSAPTIPSNFALWKAVSTDFQRRLAAGDTSQYGIPSIVGPLFMS